MSVLIKQNPCDTIPASRQAGRGEYLQRTGNAPQTAVRERNGAGNYIRGFRFVT